MSKMNIGKFSTIGAALLMVMAFSFIATAASAAGGMQVKIVENVQIGPVYFAVPADPATLDELQQMLPVELPFDLAAVRYVYLDGSAHLNLMAWEKKGVCQVDLHFVWHGQVALCDEELSPLVILDAKVVQISLHLEVPAGQQSALDLSGLDVKVNAHINGNLTFFDGLSEPLSLDASSHILLKFSDGQLVKCKIWLPEWADALLCEI